MLEKDRRNIEETNIDAVECRLSAIAAGYLQDKVLVSMAHEAQKLGSVHRRLASIKHKLPIINRGTCLRTVCIDKLVYEFCRLHSENHGIDDLTNNEHLIDHVKRKESMFDCQIVSLGAGWDTRYFGLVETGIRRSKYFEIDFPNVIEEKKDFCGNGVLIPLETYTSYRVIYTDLKRI